MATDTKEKTKKGKLSLEWTEKEMPVLEYEKGDPGFVHPEYKKAIGPQYAMAFFGVTLLTSQIGMTLGVLPTSLWPITLVTFIGGLASNIWVYYGMEHLPTAPSTTSVRSSSPDETASDSEEGQGDLK